MEEQIEKLPVPRSLEEAFALFDDTLTDEEKQAILGGDDMHFGLGLWIRNEWLYGCEKDENAALIKDITRIDNIEHGLPDDSPFSMFVSGGDMFSGFIIDRYREHLKQANSK